MKRKLFFLKPTVVLYIGLALTVLSCSTTDKHRRTEQLKFPIPKTF